MQERMMNLFLEFDEKYYIKNHKKIETIKNFLENNADIDFFKVEISIHEVLFKKLIELGKNYQIEQSLIEEEIESMINKVGYLSKIKDLWPTYRKKQVSENVSFNKDNKDKSFTDKVREIVKNYDPKSLDKNISIDDKIKKISPEYGEYRQDPVIQYQDAEVLYTCINLYPFIFSLNVKDISFKKGKIEVELDVFEEQDIPVYGKKVNFNINGAGKIVPYNEWIEKIITSRENLIDKIPTNEDDMNFYDDKPDKELLMSDIRTPAKDPNLLSHFDNIKVSEKFLLDW